MQTDLTLAQIINISLYGQATGPLPGDPPSQYAAATLAAAADLPQGVAYTEFDPEGAHGQAMDVYGYAAEHFTPEAQLAEWPAGAHDGYGTLERVATSVGPGLCLTGWGSQGNSALSVWFVPVAAVPPAPAD